MPRSFLCVQVIWIFSLIMKGSQAIYHLTGIPKTIVTKLDKLSCSADDSQKWEDELWNNLRSDWIDQMWFREA